MKDLYIFTYGTLKRGFVNNYFLDDAIFISTAITVEKYQMYPSIGNALFYFKNEKNNLYAVDYSKPIIEWKN